VVRQNSARFARLALTAGLICLPAASRGTEGAAPAAQNFTLHRLGRGVWAAVAKPQGSAGSNAGIVIGDDLVAVIDTFQSVAAAKELLSAIRRLTPLPIRYVVNTHYHLDHVTGNGVFRSAGAVILAQRNVRAWERSENLKWWGDPVPDSARRMVESLVLPDIVYDDGIDIYLGSRRLKVRSLPGHTGSDSIVVVEGAGIVFTGDLFWNRTLPNTTDADTGAWVHTDDELLSEYPKATFVPGHGEVGTAADVGAFRGYLSDLRNAVKKARAEKKEGDSLVAAVERVLQPRYADWAYYQHFIRDDITQTAAELAGTKRLPGQSP